MEAHYDMLIIDRNQRNFALRPKGLHSIRPSRKSWISMKSLTAKFKRCNIVSGTIQISTVNSIGLHELPPYLKSFIKEFPSVNARVEYRRANLVYDDGFMETRIWVWLPSLPHKELTIIPFANDELIIAMSPEHHLTKKRSIAMDDLKGIEFIAFERDIPTEKQLTKFWRKRALKSLWSWNSTMLKQSKEPLKSTPALPYSLPARWLLNRKGINWSFIS